MTRYKINRKKRISISKYFVFSIFIISFLFFYSCIRNKNPIYIENDLSEYEQYINTWPDTIFQSSIANPNPELPVDMQRKITLELAKLGLLLKFNKAVDELPVSSTKTIHDLRIENNSIQSQIYDYIYSHKITDTIFYASGQIEVKGYLSTENLKAMIISYLSENEINL